MPCLHSLRRKKTVLNINFLKPCKQLQAIAIYMIVFGVIASIWPFFATTTGVMAPASLSTWQTTKLYLREICLALTFIIGGVALLNKQLWARKICLTALALAFFYGGNKIAWLLTQGSASIGATIGAYFISFLLFGIAFIILFQQLTAENLIKD